MNLVTQFVTQEAITLKVTGFEWNFNNLVKALGAGSTTTETHAGVTYTALGFGGDINLSEIALMFYHVLPSGKKLYIDLWKASPAGEVTITFGEALHEFPYTFKALDTGTDWAGATISDSRRLMRMRLED